MIDEKSLSTQSLARPTRKFEAVSKLVTAEVTNSSTLGISQSLFASGQGGTTDISLAGLISLMEPATRPISPTINLKNAQSSIFDK